MQDYIEQVSKLARDMVRQNLNIDAKKLNGVQIQQIVNFFDSEIEICDDDDEVRFDRASTKYTIFLAKDKTYLESGEPEETKNKELYERKKETIFHELGHIFFMPIFHAQTEDTQGGLRRTGAITSEELSADYFSRAFLMPVKEFTETVFAKSHKNICNFYEVSQEFDVSNQAVVERGKDLMMWR